MLSDDGVLAINDKKQVEQFFKSAIEDYRSRGVVATKPKVEHLERLSVNLASVDVAWPSFDESGKEIGSEISHYILLLDKDEQWRIRVALTRVLNISL